MTNYTLVRPGEEVDTWTGHLTNEPFSLVMPKGPVIVYIGHPPDSPQGMYLIKALVNRKNQRETYWFVNAHDGEVDTYRGWAHYGTWFAGEDIGYRHLLMYLPSRDAPVPAFLEKRAENQERILREAQGPSSR